MDCGLSLLAEGRAVSEYQYYEFRAVDRPLDGRELRTLRSLSTRAEITNQLCEYLQLGRFQARPRCPYGELL